jgi:uracil-DNA glycosylase
MFQNIKPKWKALLLHKDLKPKLMEIMEKVEEKVNGDFSLLRPSPSEIFRAFTFFDIDDLKVIIIGQDPYPKIEEACGLSFAYRDGRPRNSLAKIYECIGPGADIELWPAQGVLLLNKWLTRSATMTPGGVQNGGSQKPNIHPFWDEYTELLVQKTINYHNRRGTVIPILMWGDKAKMNITGGCCLVWGHPSPISTYNQVAGPKNFKHCDHFTRVNQIMLETERAPIQWARDSVSGPPAILGPTAREHVSTNSNPEIQAEGPNTGPIVVFTDGGCTGNGKASAVASFGVYFPAYFMDKKNHFDESISGKVPRGDFVPTNNRGELLAIVLALEKIAGMEIPKNQPFPPVLVITDSEYSMNSINGWIHKWHKEDPKFLQRKNPDLMCRVATVLGKLKGLYGGKLFHPAALTQWKTKVELDITWPGLTIIHQRSHKKDIPRKDPKIKTGGLEYEKYLGNDCVDKLCTSAMK